MEDLNEYYDLIDEMAENDQHGLLTDLLSKRQGLLNENLIRKLDDVISVCDPQYEPYYSSLKTRIMPIVHEAIFRKWFSITDNKKSFAEAKRLIVYLAHSDNNAQFEAVKKHFADDPEFFHGIFTMVAYHAVNKLFNVKDQSFMPGWCKWAGYFLGNPLALEERKHTGLESDQSYEAYAYLAWGNLFAQKPYTGREAIFCFDKALEVINEENDKENTRLILYNKGAIKVNEVVDAKDQYADVDLNDPISFLKRSLNLCDTSTPDYSVGLTLHVLGEAYHHNSGDDTSDDLEQSIHYFEKVLSGGLFKDDPVRLGRLYMSLAATYEDRKIEGSQEKALDFYIKASNKFEKDGNDEDRATLLFNLASYYNKGFYQHRSDNVEKGLKLARISADMFLNLGDQLNWARARLLSGKFLLRPPVALLRLKEAVAAFENAMECLKEIDHPNSFYDALIMCSFAYQGLIEKDGDPNYIAAKQLAAKGLEMSEKLPPNQKAIALNCLAVFYEDNLAGDPIGNQEMGHQLFWKAYEAKLHQKRDLELDILIDINLATSFISRKAGNRSVNIETAITILVSLLEFHPQLTEKSKATAQLHLGKAFILKPKKNEHDFYSAELYLTAALLFFDEDTDPELWGETVREHAKLILHRPEIYDKSSTLDKAIADCHDLLAKLSENEDADEWIMTQSLLGSLYIRSQKLHHQISLEDKAEFHLRKAFERTSPELQSVDFISLAIFLGRHLYDTKNYEGAAEVLKSGHRSLENLRAGTILSEHKAILNTDLNDLYKLLVDSLVRLNRLEEVFEYVIAAKGRNLSEIMQSSKPQFSELIAGRPDLAVKWEAIEVIWKSIEQLQTKRKCKSRKNRLANDAESKDTQFKLAKLFHKYRHLQSELLSLHPELDQYPYAAGLERKDACQLAGYLQSKIIEFFCCESSWLALVISPDGIKVLKFADDTDELIKKVISWKTGFDEPIPGSLSKVWETRNLKDLYKSLFKPLELHIAIGDKIIIAPHGDLHSLPISLAYDEITNAYVFEKYCITNIPTINSLASLNMRSIPLDHTNNEALVVTHSGTKGNKLDYATQESATVIGTFNSPVTLTEKKATPAAFLTIANGHSFDYIHICCHGSFSKNYPEHSGLLLEGRLTVRDITQKLRLKGNPLVTLSACQSGMARVAAGDELQGIPQAIFQAGGRKVIASLWPVDDEATAAFFKVFYNYATIEGVSTSTALKKAMNSMRTIDKYHSAFYWGAFQLYGII